MSNFTYLPPYQRVVHQGAIKALLVAQFLIVMPFMSYMPNWLLIVFALVVFWRWRVLRGELTKPPKVLLVSAILVGVTGLVLSGLNRYSLDTAVAFCLLGYLLKSLEVLRRRDAVVQIYLGFFLTGVYLLYRFDPVAGVIMILLLFVNLVALQAVTSDLQFQWRYASKQTLILIVGAIPVMIAGYLFFPRLPPLWTIPNDQRGSTTGMSDELNPGSVAEIARSNAPAFRVSFSGDLPPRAQWYWRGNTLSEFNGVSWRAKYNANNRFSWQRDSRLPVALDEEYQYTVIMENSGQHWLYFLDWPTQISANDSRIMPDARDAKQTTLSSVYRYQATSSWQVEWVEQDSILKDNLALPRQGNENLRQWALERRGEYNSDIQFVESLLSYIRSENFYYTLKPPLYQGRDGIENFWFGDRRGFCEHYASAVGVILRSVGIPTRLVGGYLGGTYIEGGNYIQVRQMEAHAWLEAWINGRWLRVDPTAAVAPNRVEINLDDLFMQTQPSDLPLMTRVGRLGLVNRLSMYWDTLNYEWQVLVLDYDNEQAISWFEAGFGRISPLKLAIAVLTLMGGVALIIAVSLGMIRLPKRKREPFRTIETLERWYGERKVGETLNQYFDRIISENSDDTTLKQFKSMFESVLYNPKNALAANESKVLFRQLKQQRMQTVSKT